MPPQGRPQAARRSSQFQPGKYEIFPGGCPTRKPASQPEANQTSFFDSQKPAKPGKQRPDLARQPGPCRELIVQPFSGRPRRSTPGLLRKPTRGIVPSTLLRLWEGQCLHKAAFQVARRSSQFQPGKYEIFPGGDVQPESQPASKKPTKPFLLIARRQPNQASRGLVSQGSLGLAGS